MHPDPHDSGEKDLELGPPQNEPQATDFAERAFRSASISASSNTSSYTSSLETDGGQDFLSRVQTAQTQQSAAGGLERNITALSRIATQRSQHDATVGAGPTLRRRPTSPLPEFGGGKSMPPPLPERELFVVEFAGVKDSLHPQNWSSKRK